MPPPQRIIAWADADQEQLLRDVAENDALQLLAVGSDYADAATRLSTALGVDRIDDLRRAVLRDDADLLWIAGATAVDAPTVKLIREQGGRGLRVLACQPFPASLAELPAHAEDAAAIRCTPPMRRSAGYRAAIDVLGDFGAVRCVNVTMRCGAGQCSLFSRLFDAADVVESLCGGPEVIDAALVSPQAVGTSSVAENLAGLHGHMTINVRFPENRCACVAISDHAGTWFRGVTALGDGGCLRISDDGFEWITLSGEVVESHQEEEPSTPGSLIAEHMLRVLGRLDTSDAPPDAAKLLAICEAARLSCRTGHGETPHKVLKMLSHV